MKWEIKQLPSGWWSVWFDGQWINASLRTEQDAEAYMLRMIQRTSK